MIWSTSKQQRTGRRWKWHDGRNFQFSSHSHGVKFQHLCPDGGDGGIAFPLSSSVQIRSVFKSIFMQIQSWNNYQNGWSLLSFFLAPFHKDTVMQRRSEKHSHQSEPGKWLLCDSPQWGLVFQFLKIKCVWQHVHRHSWSSWWVTLHKAATRSPHSWSWSRCYIETLDEFHKIWVHVPR